MKISHGIVPAFVWLALVWLGLFGVSLTCGCGEGRQPSLRDSRPTQLDACQEARLQAEDLWAAWSAAWRDFIQPNVDAAVRAFVAERPAAGGFDALLRFEAQGYVHTTIADAAADAAAVGDYLALEQLAAQSTAEDMIARRARAASWRVVRECPP